MGATPFSSGPGAPVDQLVVTDTSLVAITRSSLSTFDLGTGTPLSERFAFDTADAVALPETERLVVDTRELSDREAAATFLVDELSLTPSTSNVCSTSTVSWSRPPTSATMR